MTTKLGSRVVDILTGFKGVAIGRSEFLMTSPQVLVQPETLDKGRVPEATWLDERRITLDERGGSPVPGGLMRDHEHER